jgi:hypothetical protein
MDNTLPIIAPLGDISMAYPSNTGMHGKAQVGSVDMKNQVHHEGIQIFTPVQSTLLKNSKNKLEQTRQMNGITRIYLHYYRQFQSGLAYFEIDGKCAYFDDPKIFRNEIRFPIKVIGENRTAAYDPDAVHFDFPNGLMLRIYPYTVDADDWSSCLMSRAGDKSNLLTRRASKSKRFGNTCELVNKQLK